MLPSEYRNKYAKIALAFCCFGTKIKSNFGRQREGDRGRCRGRDSVATTADVMLSEQRRPLSKYHASLPLLCPLLLLLLGQKCSTPTQLIYLKIHFVFVFIFNCQIFCVYNGIQSLYMNYIFCSCSSWSRRIYVYIHLYGWAVAKSVGGGGDNSLCLSHRIAFLLLTQLSIVFE